MSVCLFCEKRLRTTCKRTCSSSAGSPDELIGKQYRISPISFTATRNPHWRADSRELFYLDAAGAMTAVPIDLTAISPAGLPTTLFPAAVVSNYNMYAVTKDGQQFLVNRPQSAGTAPPLTVIVNWISTLQR